MFKVNINFLKTGMILAKAIYGSDGQILLNAGVIVKENYIDKLIKLGISSLYIDTKETADIIIEDVICEQNRLEAKNMIRETMNNVYMGGKINTKDVFRAVNNIVDDLLSKKDIILNLSDIKAVDDYTFGHSVNVCVLCLITGIAMGYDREKLEKLGIGAILHDIGKIAIPEEILNKPEKLTDEEYEIIKTHPRLGYEIIKRNPSISSLSAVAVLTHHERYDGLGYPLGKKGQALHEFSKILAIADVYDALTSDRVYKKGIFPHEAIEYLVSMGKHQFDYEIVKIFALNVACYPVGTIVALSTGDQGIVSEVNKSYPNRPKVRYLRNKEGEKYVEIVEVALDTNPSITIIEVLENIE
ncbi:HD-GYP domain-containing protein [Marinisporobacter balticus]|uniref:HD-GYP domain-containing protein (C-di-GMP phosphodiesterase class II) n=1 Tax=Marinisporobacter balticus TaxID=2018667 RepID=A0A4R2KQ87_9FIRM|nr:HD-GYP domain-containing protein [Marinisporobacter balticus]TCO68775.1 HD-GYP domain-containing protein (c-di-GMP phosphodiesterase class II) [Marinisporobacter balticus]